MMQHRASSIAAAMVMFGAAVNLATAGPAVMRTVANSTMSKRIAGKRYIMWNKYSAGTSSCNLLNSGQKLDVQRIPDGCSGVTVSFWVDA